MITTIQITHTEAALIRMVAKVDMPAYGLREGQVFYAAKSTSLGNNQYHILTWDYENKRWDCPCKCGQGYDHKVACKHTKAVSADCKKAHSLQGYKPVLKQIDEQLSKAEKFAQLMRKYDVRYQAPAIEKIMIEAEQVAKEAERSYHVSPELKRAGAFSILR